MCIEVSGNMHCNSCWRQQVKLVKARCLACGSILWTVSKIRSSTKTKSSKVGKTSPSPSKNQFAKDVMMTTTVIVMMMRVTCRFRNPTGQRLPLFSLHSFYLCVRREGPAAIGCTKTSEGTTIWTINLSPSLSLSLYCAKS